MAQLLLGARFARRFPLALASVLLVACGGGSSTRVGAGTVAAGDDGARPRNDEPDDARPEPPPLLARSVAPTTWMSGLSGVLRTRVAPPLRGVMGDFSEQYRTAAPATVIVHTEHGIGTGVVLPETRPGVAAGGLIVTNAHVVADAIRTRAGLMVWIQYGRLDSRGSMTRAGRERRGRVVRRDPGHDLALIRVDDPIEVEPIRLASEAPGAGSEVACLGHPDNGMAWTIRPCNVERIGSLRDDYSRVRMLCRASGSSARARCRELREYLSGEAGGAVIQTTCDLVRGQSGGPLINEDGELVGLNVLTLGDAQSRRSYHIHLDDIRAFIGDGVPAAPIREVPRPWLERAVYRAGDLDRDGRRDTLFFLRSDGAVARWHDLDQDSRHFPLSRLTSGESAERLFDAELAIVSRDGMRFFWYDSNSDGRLDLVLSQDARGRVVAARTVAADGSVEAVPELLDGPAIRPELVPPGARERLERIISSIGVEDRPPPPLPAMLSGGRLVDTDSDGRSDAIQADLGDVRAVAFDTDQDSLRRTRGGGLSIDIEMSVIQVGPTLWAYYDLDRDGRPESGLRSAAGSPVVLDVTPSRGSASSALRREDFLGRLVIDPARVDAPSSRIASALIPRGWIAGSGDLDGLPNPISHHESPVATRNSAFRDDWWNAIVTLRSAHITSLLIDVDRSSVEDVARRLRREGLATVVADGHFSFDFAVVRMNRATWTWYDTDLDGTWDVVLVHVRDGEDTLHNAFRRSGDAFVHAAELVDGALFRPSLFPAEHRARFEALVAALFRAPGSGRREP